MALIATLLFSLSELADENPTRSNTGFLVFGALLAVVATLLAGWFNRPIAATDLARGIHVELADRVARCCFDYEEPWAQFDPPAANAAGMDVDRLRRFASFPPIIYPAAAAQLSLLPGDALQTLLKFYYRLAAWQRDVDTVAARHSSMGVVPNTELRRLGRRIRETVAPGLAALEAFSPLVGDADAIEADLLAGYDTFRKDRDPAYTPDRSLKQRLRTQIARIHSGRTGSAAAAQSKG